MLHAETVTFGTSGLDRAAVLRRDGERLKAALAAGAPVLPLWQGKPMVVGTPDAGDIQLAFRKMGDAVLSKTDAEPVLLGLDETGDQPVFALDVSAWEPKNVDQAAINAFRDPSVQVHPAERLDGAGFRELRGLMTHMTRREAELAATARAVLGWHRTHLFCAKCGKPSQAAEAGWQRDCGSCGAKHFPRTDPVVIMLITHGDAVLVGRSPGWPEGMYSLLAGFVEPGETIEAAVRREVFEESGIRVGHVDYLSSQPWPFPASLMFGCRGEALSTEIEVDPEEIEDAKWVTRSQMLEVFAGNDPTMLPARTGAIAHFLLQHWLADTLD
ncbi:NAD(+) diphosphatase [Hasllibacter sp. MH4015]|uniref:NAD(+) diphosphatase n=1 Tax=Hasllibacter sp. MH4015 TaxID=2854029 RepID=UPI001CD3398D|nr:NAD(+) diphosphatase [Hasllibacter sp. MH4015]